MSVSARLETTKTPFSFSRESEVKLEKILKKYPQDRKRSAILPFLDLAQRDNGGWLSRQAIEEVAKRLELSDLYVWEVASFYTMFSLEPTGKYLVQLCRTTPCWLRGSNEVLQACRDKLGVDVGETSKDGQFTVIEVECLGACVNAPMVQINDDYYEDLTYDSMTQLLEKLSRDEDVHAGTQIDRLNSAPEGGFTTLKAVPVRKATSAKKATTAQKTAAKKAEVAKVSTPKKATAKKQDDEKQADKKSVKKAVAKKPAAHKPAEKSKGKES